MTRGKASRVSAMACALFKMKLKLLPIKSPGPVLTLEKGHAGGYVLLANRYKVL